MEDSPQALGVVLEDGRGSLPFALVHGEALVVAAAWAMGEAGVTLVDIGTDWSDVVDEGLPLVLHDALCPLTPAAFVAACLEEADRDGVVVVGVRPVTDTVRQVDGGFLGETLDREGLLALASPVVLPAPVVAALPGPPGSDLAALVAALAERGEVRTRQAPPEGRRVSSEDDVRLLEALTRPDGAASVEPVQ